MQIPKFLLMYCVAALGLSPLHAQRVDTAEQAKARELLRKKMAELDVESTPQPTAKKPKKSAPVFAPVPTKPFPTRDSSGAPPLGSPTQPVTKTAPEPAAVPAPAVPAPAPAPAPAVAAPAQRAPNPTPASVVTAFTETIPATSPARLSPEAEAKAREELRRKIAAPGGSETAVSSGAPRVSGRQPVVRKEAQDVFAAPPTAPNPIPPAVPAAKAQSLADLLTLYRANTITPEEYHKRRADILAKP